MNTQAADNSVQWLFLDLNAFFASCEQQEKPALRGRPVIVVQTPAESAVAIAASYAAKAFGIKTGTLVREARRLCPDVVPVRADHRLYTDYHERILKAVDTCLPVDKVMSIDEIACRLMGTERQVPPRANWPSRSNLPEVLLPLELQDIYGIGSVIAAGRDDDHVTAAHRRRTRTPLRSTGVRRVRCRGSRL